MNHYTEQFERYSDATLAYALADCYETLSVGAGVHGNAYVAKLWWQIDAIRDIQTNRGKKAKQ
tara:strand:- start:379 stop:567 length:189 start_codon:yes stop_codon:yes gene_type:complete